MRPSRRPCFASSSRQDEADTWALTELTQLRRAAGDAKEVVHLLLRRAELAEEGTQATSLRHEAALVMLDDLRDLDGATALYQEILDADPYDVQAAVVLRRLYDEGGRFKDLAKLLELLIDVARSQEARTPLRLELARLYHDRIRSADDAIEVLRDVLREEPAHATAVLELSRLYEETGRDGELADLLKDQLHEARERGDVAEELSLLVRLGELEELRLGDTAAAARTYEQVLERDPSHRGALEAVARMSERREDWRRAADALAALVDGATDAAGAAWALRLADARDKSGDAAGAEDALRRGLALEPANPTIRAKLRVRWEKSERWADSRRPAGRRCRPHCGRARARRAFIAARGDHATGHASREEFSIDQEHSARKHAAAASRVVARRRASQAPSHRGGDPLGETP